MEVFDVTEAEQAAELMIRCLPRAFKFLVDYLGRWYNNALLVIERNNGGDAFIDDLRLDLAYPNLWRKVQPAATPSRTGARVKRSPFGFYTGSTSKPILNGCLKDNIRADGHGVTIYSRRLLKQLMIYVRKRSRAGGDTDKTEAESGPGNFDDLVMATGLALVGWSDATLDQNRLLAPVVSDVRLSYSADQPVSKALSAQENAQELWIPGGVLLPVMMTNGAQEAAGAFAEIQKFTRQLGALPTEQALPQISHRRHVFK
jgi:hypothetical protein